MKELEDKIRKDEKIKEVQEIRSKWKYPEPVVNIKNKLDKIFEEFDESKTSRSKVELFNVPLSLAISQCLDTVVKE